MATPQNTINKELFNVDLKKLKKLQNDNKKDSVQNNISLDTQHYELGLSESTQIQKQLNFCQDVQLEYIKKHEELKTVFALALNLFQFYTYTLEIIDSLLKIQTPKQEPGYFTERNVILTTNYRTNIKIPLISNYQPTKDADGNITDTISVEEISDNLGQSSIRKLQNGKDTVLTCYTFNINEADIRGTDKFELKNSTIKEDTIKNNFELTIKRSQSSSIENNDQNKNLDLRLKITIKNKDAKSRLKDIFVNIYYIPDLEITPPASSAPPPIGVSTPLPAVTSSIGPGGQVYFNRIKEDTFNQLKKHQEKLREKLKGLNDLIVNTTTTGLKLDGKDIDIPLLNETVSSGGAIKSIVENKSSKQKKSKKGPFEISKVINQLIGGNPVDIPFFYTGEIVQKKNNNIIYYFLELLQDSGSGSGSLLPSTLNANIEKKNYEYKLHKINDADIINTNTDPKKYIKEDDTPSIIFQNRSEFINDIKDNVSGVNKDNMLLNQNVKALFDKLQLKQDSFNEIDLCQQAFIRIKEKYSTGDNKLTVKIEY